MEMTREEAARIIKECKEKGFKYTFYTVEVYYAALDIAIKAIEQQEAIEECTCCEYRVGGECCYAEVEQTEDVISREVARRIIDSGRSKEQMLEVLNNTPPVNPQEPFKPMVEIDLDYVIKQKYIERDALDKIIAEIEERKLNSGGEPNRELAFNVCLKIIDKYRAESEKV